mgnify:CR=1 FL=1
MQLFGGPVYGITNKMSEEDAKSMVPSDNSKLLKDLRTLRLGKTMFIGKTGNTFGKVGNSYPAASGVYWSTSGRICIMSYPDLYMIFNYDDLQKAMTYHSTINKQVNTFFYE